jgi:hypothetical protein
LARWLVDERSLAWPLAPALGWAVLTALALPTLNATGFSWTSVTALFAVAAVGSVLLLRRGSAPGDSKLAIPIWAFASAVVVAILPALGVWPKFGESGLVLADPIFDHSKIAIIDDIVRLGLPPGNPFFGGSEAVLGLAYYYLWHFSAAAFDVLSGGGGWAADIALTWFTAFASLSLMMGLAVKLGANRLSAPIVLLLSLAGSLAPVLHLALAPDVLDRTLAPTQTAQPWLFQASWVPQHLASACCVVLAMLILSRLSWKLVPVLATVVAAGFESSAWVGGVVFAAAAASVGIVMLLQAEGVRGRLELVAQLAAAVILAAIIAYPFLRDELAATAARQLGSPIAYHPYEVLGSIVPELVRRALDLPAYWGILLTVAFPTIYPAGAIAIWGALADRQATATERRLVVALTLLTLASFGVPWLFASTIANNDLGWRGVLPGILVLTPFAAAGLARWLATARKHAIAAIACLALGIPGGFAIVAENAIGRRLPSAAALAETPELWAAVRRHSAPSERIANNPLFFSESVGWPVNISWALFADRRSCFAGWNLARAFAPLPEFELDRLERAFDRVFAGEGSPQDIEEIATRHDCRVIVVTARDGVWDRDPFAEYPRFRLIDQRPGKWRIYRVVELPRE